MQGIKRVQPPNFSGIFPVAFSGEIAAAEHPSSWHDIQEIVQFEGLPEKTEICGTL